VVNKKLANKYMQYLNVKDILSNPVTTVPTLSEIELKSLLVETILMFIDRSINFEKLTALARTLSKYSAIQTSSELALALEKINTLPKYSEEKGESIDKILTEALETLIRY
jgi:hypothetical protein